MKYRNANARRLARRRLVGAFAVLATLAAACGDDDDASEASDETGAADATSATGTADPSESDETTASSETTAGSSGTTTGSNGDEELAGTPEPDPLPERTTVTMTMPIKIEGFADFLLADVFGEFEQENIEVKVVTVPASDALLLMNSGEADVVLGSPSAAFLNTVNEGFDNSWILPNYTPNPESIAGLWIHNDVLGDDGVAQPEEIEGISIGLGTLGLAAPSALVVYEFLDGLGLTLDDIEVSNVQGADMVTALENGGIQAGVVLDPFNRQVQGDGYATFVEPFGGYSLGGFLAGAIREEDPDVLDAFVRAIVRSRRTYLQGDYHSDPQVVTALATEIGVEEAVVQENPPLVWSPDATIDPTAIELMQQMWLDAGVVEFDEPFAPDTVIDQSSLDRVLG